MTKEQLQEVLRLHKLWLEDHKDGVRACLYGALLYGANLKGADLREVNLERAYLEGANLEGANLEGANFQEADLRGANLEGANLEGADLWMVNLKGADLQGSDLRGVDLRWADLEGANLKEANLKEASLKGVNLKGANLGGADLKGANLKEANLKEANLTGASLRWANLGGAENIPDYVLKTTLITPEGDLTGYKKCREGMIVTLLIPSDSPRHNATTNKCRAKYAKVIAIKDPEGNPVDTACSEHRNTFKYVVGQTVVADNYDPDRFNECAGGIHFFLTEKEAREY